MGWIALVFAAIDAVDQVVGGMQANDKAQQQAHQQKAYAMNQAEAQRMYAEQRNQIAKQQADFMGQEADYQRAAKNSEQAEMDRKQAVLRARAVAQGAGAGLSIGSGSLLDVLNQSEKDFMFDRDKVGFQRDVAAWDAENKRSLILNQGNLDKSMQKYNADLVDWQGINAADQTISKGNAALMKSIGSAAMTMGKAAVSYFGSSMGSGSNGSLLNSNDTITSTSQTFDNPNIWKKSSGSSGFNWLGSR